MKHDEASELRDLPPEGEPIEFFRDLPAMKLDAAEHADLKRSVHELIRSRALDDAIDATAADDSPARAPRPGRRSTSRWRRVARSVRAASRSTSLRLAAALAAVALATSLLWSALAPTSAEPTSLAAVPAALSAPSAADLAAIESLPLVENLDGETELIQIEDEDMSLVVAAVR